MPTAKLQISRTRGKLAACYLRKSSDQQEASIPRQRESVRHYAIRNGYELTVEYVDSGITGLNSVGKRTKFQELIDDAAAGKFQYVIVWDQSRLTRSDAMKTAAELQPLRDTGVKLVTCDKGVIEWDNFAGQLLMQIEAETNNAYMLARGRNSATSTYCVRAMSLTRF